MDSVKQLQQRGHRLGTEQPLRLTFYDVEGSEKWRPDRFWVSERSPAEYKEEMWKKNEYFKFAGILGCIDWLPTFRSSVVPSSLPFYLARWKHYASPKRRVSLDRAYHPKKKWTAISIDDRTSNFASYATGSLESQVRLHLFRISEVNWSGQLQVIRGANHTAYCTCRKNVRNAVV
jgi:hypothetical protein